jgi:cytoskeletal protein CcmA (bactofilin family)
MKSLKHVACIISIALATSGAQAAPLLSGTLNDQTVFSHTYTTTGASLGNQTVWGNILANQDATLGAGAKVSGNTQSRDLTTGDAALVSGNTTTVGDTSIGANAIVKGDLKSVDLTVGANGTIEGNAVNVADSTLGASAKVVGILQSGAAVTIGATAVVTGLVEYGTALVVSASATTLSGTALIGSTPPATVIADEHLGVTAAQTTLNAMAGTPLATGNIATSQTFTPGVYNVTGLLTTTAGITLNLDATGVEDADFIFNVSNYLSFGAGTIINVIGGNDDTSVVWNTPGGYTSVGANARIVGTILANTYASTGAYSTVTGSGDSCGGVFSATSYVTVGANATVGGQDCEGTINICIEDGGIVDCSPPDCTDDDSCPPDCTDDDSCPPDCTVDDSCPPVCTDPKGCYDVCIMTEHDGSQPDQALNLIKISEYTDGYNNIVVTGITQDEETSGLFTGDISRDGKINSKYKMNAMVRNERDNAFDDGGNGDGRVYHINYTALNDYYEAVSGTVKVVIPTFGCDCDEVVDSGQNFNSLLISTPTP